MGTLVSGFMFVGILVLMLACVGVYTVVKQVNYLKLQKFPTHKELFKGNKIYKFSVLYIVIFSIISTVLGIYSPINPYAYFTIPFVSVIFLVLQTTTINYKYNLRTQ